MGPARFPFFGLATAPGVPGCAPGATAVFPRVPGAQLVELVSADLGTGGTPSPPGDPGCTDVGPVVNTIFYSDGVVIEWID